MNAAKHAEIILRAGYNQPNRRGAFEPSANRVWLVMKAPGYIALELAAAGHHGHG
jgi:hypothetical protein